MFHEVIFVQSAGGAAEIVCDLDQFHYAKFGTASALPQISRPDLTILCSNARSRPPAAGVVQLLLENTNQGGSAAIYPLASVPRGTTFNYELARHRRSVLRAHADAPVAIRPPEGSCFVVAGLASHDRAAIATYIAQMMANRPTRWLFRSPGTRLRVLHTVQF